MGQKVRADRFQVPLGSAGQSADGLEILLSAPTRREGWESHIDDLGRSHFDVEAGNFMDVLQQESG